jgi:MFS family permease
MLSGGILAGIGIAALATADSMVQIVLFGTLMAIGSAALASANWAALADVTAGRESGRLLGLVNFGTAGAAAAAGLFGPFIDSVDSMAAGSGYPAALLAAAAIALCGGLVAWRGDSVPTAHAMRPVQVGD